MMTAQALLPRNVTPLERQAAQALADIQRVPIPLRQLYNPDLCPPHLLPYLAWAFSVDRWDPRWSDAAKRTAIRASFYIHACKGTLGALRRVVEPLGYLIEVEEWWQTVPEREPGTFALKVEVLDTGITEEMYQELTRLIDDAKPVSRHMTRLAFGLETTAALWFGACVLEGEVTTIYPLHVTLLELTCTARDAASVAVTVEMTTLYPLQPTLLEQHAYPAREAVGGDSGEQTTLHPLHVTALEQQAEPACQSIAADAGELTTIYPLEA
jgi:phage tail P2-like protein